MTRLEARERLIKVLVTMDECRQYGWTEFRVEAMQELLEQASKAHVMPGPLLGMKVLLDRIWEANKESINDTIEQICIMTINEINKRVQKKGVPK